jgi:hypothetical protein
MMSLWAIAMQLVSQIVGWFIKNEKQKAEYEAEIKKQVEQYQREIQTSADIRKAEGDTLSRLKERFKQK